MYKLKSILILLFLLFTINGYCAWLGEHEQGRDIYLWTQFNAKNGQAATNVTATNCAIFDHDDASSPTASGALIEWDLTNTPGLFRYEYKPEFGLLATGSCVARLTGTVGINGVRPAATHTLFVVDSGKGPSKRSTLTTSDNIGINWADVSNPTTALDLAGTDIQLVDTATDVTNGVTVTTNNDKTGYSLAATQTFDMTGDITGNLSGSVGSLTANNDKTGYSLSDSDAINKQIIAVAMRNIDIATASAVQGSVVQKIEEANATIFWTTHP